MAGKRNHQKKLKEESKKNPKNGRHQDNDSLLYEYRYEIGFVLMSAFSVILFLANLGFAGIIGDAVKMGNFGLFGFFAWLTPFFLFFATTVWIANRRNRGVKLKIWLSFFILMNMAAIAELISYPSVSSLNLKDLYLLSATRSNGGGFLGGLPAKLLASGMALPGAYIILISLLIILVIFLTGRFFVNPIKRRAAETRDHIIELKNEQLLEAQKRAEIRSEFRKEAREMRREERERQREERRIKLSENLQRAEALKLQSRSEAERISEEEKKGENEEEKEKSLIEQIKEQDRLYREVREKQKREVHLTEIGASEKSDLSTVFGDEPCQGKKDSGEDGISAALIENKFGKEEPKKESEPHVLSVSGVEEKNAPTLSWSLVLKNEEEIREDFSDSEAYDEFSTGLKPSLERTEGMKYAEDVENYDNIQEEDDFFVDNEAGAYENEDVFEDEIEDYEDYVDAGIEFEEEIVKQLLEEKAHIGRSSSDDSLKEGEAPLDGETRKAKSTVPSMTEIKSIEPSSTKKEETPASKDALQYTFPPIELLVKAEGKSEGVTEAELFETSEKLQRTLEAFGVKAKVTDVSCGPSVTRYELQPEIGVKVSKITSLADDIKLNLAAADIRIEAPIPGKAAVGIEVPNKQNTMVFFRDLIENKEFLENTSKISFAVGKDIAGKTMVTDIAKMPHLLIAGATGSGKSVCINTLIMSMLYKARPDEVKFIMIDPKVVELSCYNGIPHLLLPVVTDPKKAAAALNWAVVEMNRRYTLFAEEGVRNIKGYNKAIGRENPNWMPQIVIIVDELADLMMVSSKEVEESICRLAQLARAAGIHLVIATQRPSVNVITGLIKANIPSRIAFAVSSQVDSRTILDGAGAEKLLGKGDMLFFPSGYPKPVRVQGAFVSDNEVSNVVDFIRNHNGDSHNGEDITEAVNQVAAAESMKEIADKSQNGDDADDYDEYFDEAGTFIIEKGKASIGMLQRVYRIGFNRAARIMDQLAEAGVVSEEDGTRARKILMNREEFMSFLALRHGEAGLDEEDGE